MYALYRALGDIELHNALISGTRSPTLHPRK